MRSVFVHGLVHIAEQIPQIIPFRAIFSYRRVGSKDVDKFEEIEKQ
jgi:hypothetical protein